MVDIRIAGAEKSSTYLLAGVEVVATYKVYGVNCQKLEALIHKVFAAAQINLSIPDRFGNMVKPREWFLVPLGVINEAVNAHPPLILGQCVKLRRAPGTAWR